MKYQVHLLLTLLASILALNYICEAGGGHSMIRRSSARNSIQGFEQQDKPSRPIQRKRSTNARSINFGNQGRQSSKDISARAMLLNEPFNEDAGGRLIATGRKQFGGKPRGGKRRMRRSRSRFFQPLRRFERQTSQDCKCDGKKTVGREIGAPIESTLTSDLKKHDLNRAFDTNNDFSMRSAKKESLTDKLFAKFKPQSKKPVEGEVKVGNETTLEEETINEQEESEETPSSDDEPSPSSSTSPSPASTSEGTALVGELKVGEKDTTVEEDKKESLQRTGSADLNNQLNVKIDSAKEKILGASDVATNNFETLLEKKEEKIDNLLDNVVESKGKALDKDGEELKTEIDAGIKDNGEGLVDAKENTPDGVSNAIEGKENLVGKVIDEKEKVLDDVINIKGNIVTDLENKAEKVVEEKEDALKKGANVVEKVEDVKEEVIEEIEDTSTKVKAKKKGVKESENTGSSYAEVAPVSSYAQTYQQPYQQAYQKPYQQPYQAAYQPTYQQQTIVSPPKNSYYSPSYKSSPYYQSVSPLKCYGKVLELELVLIELLTKLEKLKSKLHSSDYRANETRDILYQIALIKRAIEDSLYAIKSNNLKLLAGHVRKVGRELSRLSKLSAGIELKISLPSVSKLHQKYNKFKKICKLAT